MTSLLSSAALLASSVLLSSDLSVSASTPCQFGLEDTVAQAISYEVDLMLSVSDESLPTFNDQLRLMGYSGSPGDINDLTPPHQRVMFNSYLNSANGNNYFTGYEGGEFLGYYPDDLLFRWRPAGAYNASLEQRTVYTFDPLNGDAKDVVDTEVYDPRERGWYQDAMSKCTSDLLGDYTCELHWTAPYVFKSDSSLGITPALGFLDHSSGSPLGVSAYGFKLSKINTILSDAVQGNNAMVAYIMDEDGGLIAVSNDASVVMDDVRVNAKDSTDTTISSSATLIIDEHYRSDLTILVDSDLITVKRYEKDDQILWLIVIVEPYDSTDTGGESDCIIELETDLMEISRSEIDLYLTNIIEAGDLVMDAFRLGLIASYVAPSVVDETNGVQDYLWALIRNCDYARSIYVGYEDGTFVNYNHGDYLSFRPPDGSVDTTRYYYHYDESSGDSNSGAYNSKVYDPRVRPWYTHAEQLGSGSFSPVYVFATGGALGLTYSVPFYENEVFRGVVGVDFEISTIDDILEMQSEPGFGIFVFENERTSADDAYDMIASSSGTVVANTTRQHKAYDAFHVENYYVATVSQYLYDNNIVHDLEVLDLTDVTAEILNYDARTLNWRLVAYNSKVTSTESTDSTVDSTDDDIDTILDLATASVILLVLMLAIVITGFIFAKQGADASRTSPPLSNSADKDSAL